MNEPARTIRHADHPDFQRFLAHLLGCLEINLTKGRAKTQADIDGAIAAVLDTHPDVTSTADADQRVGVARGATAHLCDHERKLVVAERQRDEMRAALNEARQEVAELKLRLSRRVTPMPEVGGAAD